MYGFLAWIQVLIHDFHKMYTALAKHGGLSLSMKCKGDLWIDDHHTADESRLLDFHLSCPTIVHRTVLLRWGLHSSRPSVKSVASGVMGQGLLPWMRLIPIFNLSQLAHFMPCFQALSRAVIDICSRPYCVTDLGLRREKIGDLSTEMIPHIFYSFAMASGVTLHIDVLRGENDHHRYVRQPPTCLM